MIIIVNGAEFPQLRAEHAGIDDATANLMFHLAAKYLGEASSILYGVRTNVSIKTGEVYRAHADSIKGG